MRNSSLGTIAVLFLSVAFVLREGQCQGENGDYPIPNGNQQNWGIPNGDMANWGSQYGAGNWANQNGGQMGPNQNDWQNWKNQYGGKKWNKKSKDGKKAKKGGNNWAADWQKWAGIGNGGGNSQWLQMAEQYMSQWRNNNGTIPTNGMYGKKNKKDSKKTGGAAY